MEVIMEFKVFIKRNPLARKIFGKREIVIIGKQMSGVGLTQSEKNRLSRDIRPKLKFIKEAAMFSEDFDLKKGSENKKIIKETVELIKNDIISNKVEEIWLFGSIIKNEMTTRSDIDIVVLFNDIDLKESTKFRIRIGRQIDKKVDVQVFSKLKREIKESILKSHKVLYKRDGK
jgi:predicted nucleotidyltransferase